MSVSITSVNPSDIDAASDTSITIDFNVSRSVTGVVVTLVDGSNTIDTAVSTTFFPADANTANISLDSSGLDLSAVPSGTYNLYIVISDGSDNATSTAYSVNITNLPTPTPTPTFTDKPQIEDILNYPNPYSPVSGEPARFSFTVTNKNVDQVTILVYSSALRLIREYVFEMAAKDQIINRGYIELPAEAFAPLANGAYFYSIRVKGEDGETVRGKPGKLIIIK
ncbi:MAG TPA: hypothetical protein ENN55_05110 [Firmicutes bacterium]|nr:hypothetical protein [Bacillota bacterium]